MIHGEPFMDNLDLCLNITPKLIFIPGLILLNFLITRPESHALKLKADIFKFSISEKSYKTF